MIRIPRAELDYAIAAIRGCANAARDKQGLRLIFPMTDERAEELILAGLGLAAPIGPCRALAMDAESECEPTSAAEAAARPIRQVEPPLREVIEPPPASDVDAGAP